jgi:hypothetical protein
MTIPDWALCIQCRTAVDLESPGEAVDFIQAHDACGSRIYTSYQVAEIGITAHEPEKIGRFVSGLDIHSLFLDRVVRPKRFLSVETMLKQSKAANDAKIKAAALLSENKIARLSDVDRKTVYERFHAGLEPRGKSTDSCQHWNGSAAIRLFSGAKTVLTLSPLSVATYLAFGAPLMESQARRQCGDSSCLNPSHLERAAKEPRILSGAEILQQLLDSADEASPGSCLAFSNIDKPVVVQRSPQKFLSKRILLRYLSSFNDDIKWPVLIPKCGFTPCMNPDHAKSEQPDAARELYLNRLLASTYEVLEPELTAANSCFVPSKEALQRVVEIASEDAGWFSIRHVIALWPVPTADDLKTLMTSCLSWQQFGWAFFAPNYITHSSELSEGMNCDITSECVQLAHRLEWLIENSTEIVHSSCFELRVSDLISPEIFSLRRPGA